MKNQNEIKVGDIVTLVGDTMAGVEKVWTFVVKTVNYEGYDESECSGPEMTFTSGHRFIGDSLRTQRSNNVGRSFTKVAVSKIS